MVTENVLCLHAVKCSLMDDIGPLNAGGQKIADVQGKTYLQPKCFGNVRRVDSGGSWALMPDVPQQTIGDQPKKEFGVRRQLEGLNKNKPVGTDYIYPAIIESLTNVIAGSVCELFHASMNQDEIPKDWSSAVAVAIYNVGPFSVKGDLR